MPCKDRLCSQNKTEQMKAVNESKEIKYTTSEMLLFRLLRHHAARNCSIFLLCFFELQVLLNPMLSDRCCFAVCWSFQNLSGFSIFKRSIFFLTEVILQFFSPFLSRCFAHPAELQCFGSESLQSFFYWSQPVTLMEHLQFICSSKDEAACLLYLVALLSFRAIISPAVKLCL